MVKLRLEQLAACLDLTYADFCPLSSGSSGSRDEARLKVRLARLQLEAQEKAQNMQAQLQFQLEIKRLEIEADKAVRLRQLELESQKLTQAASTPAEVTGNPSPSTIPPRISFDISKHVALVPTFRETEVDSYFGAFERIAAAL